MTHSRQTILVLAPGWLERAASALFVESACFTDNTTTKIESFFDASCQIVYSSVDVSV